MIIAMLAALATPSFIAMIRDRRVVRAGLFVIDEYREARTRALARGIAVLVHWQGDASGRGKITMREAIVAPGAGVTKGCTTSDWSDGSADTRVVNEYDFASPTYELLNMTAFSDAGAGAPVTDVCYSPDGRTSVRYADNGVMTPMTGVLKYEVLNNRTNQKRIVFVPPNGVARYQL